MDNQFYYKLTLFLHHDSMKLRHVSLDHRTSLQYSSVLRNIRFGEIVVFESSNLSAMNAVNPFFTPQVKIILSNADVLQWFI